ncbi:hypothetical protein D3C86_2195620 [compost metagenome]
MILPKKVITVPYKAQLGYGIFFKIIKRGVKDDEANNRPMFGSGSHADYGCEKSHEGKLGELRQCSV